MRVFWGKTGIDTTIEDLETPMELNEADNLILILPLVQDDIIKRYLRSFKFDIQGRVTEGKVPLKDRAVWKCEQDYCESRTNLESKKNLIPNLLNGEMPY